MMPKTKRLFFNPSGCYMHLSIINKHKQVFDLWTDLLIHVCSCFYTSFFSLNGDIAIS